MMSIRSRAAARGFTLIELMVASALGMVLTLIVAQAFISSKESFKSVEQVSRLQEGARFAVATLGRVGRMAGYISDPSQVTANSAPNKASIYPTTARALTGVNGGGSNSDEFTVRFQGSGTGTADGTILDCVGNEIKAGDMAVNRFYVATGANGRTSLFCDYSLNAGAATAVELVANVENMQVLFGEDTNADQTADVYRSAGSVVNMDNVVSIRVAFLMSTDDGVAVAAASRTFTLLTTTVTSPTDSRIRRAFTTTIAFRNRAS